MNKMKLKDFVIKGELGDAPVETKRYGNHYELLIELGKDATGHFIVDEDGMEWLRENNLIDESND